MSTYCVPGTVLDVCKNSVNKTRIPGFPHLLFQWSEIIDEITDINTWHIVAPQQKPIPLMHRWGFSEEIDVKNCVSFEVCRAVPFPKEQSGGKGES